MILARPCAALLLAASCVARTDADAPYPRSLSQTHKLRIYAQHGLSPGDQLTLETLGGGLARSRPELYRITNGVNDTDSYALWLSEMQSNFGVLVDATYVHDYLGLLALYKGQITGYIKHTMQGANANAALTFVAGQKQTELLVAASTPVVLSLLDKWSVPLVRDVSNLTELDAFQARGASAFSQQMISFQVPSQYSNLAEYAVFAAAPTIAYACTGLSGIQLSACLKLNPRGGEAAEAIVQQFAQNGPDGPKVALGWGPESSYVATLGASGFYVHASDDAHDVTAIANIAAHAALSQRHVAQLRAVKTKSAQQQQPVASPGKHQVAFLMSDGDNLQWMFNNFVTDADHWWGSPDRGAVPLGWTLSPALVELGPVVLEHLSRTASPNDDFVGAPSGVGYAYPSVWDSQQQQDFGALTQEFLQRTSTVTASISGINISAVNVIGDPCAGGVYFPGCPGLNSPNMSSVGALLEQDDIDGVFWYTFGAGYSGWHGTEWYHSPSQATSRIGTKKPKPVIGGRFSLWGEAKSGTMLGVHPLVEQMKLQMIEGKISRDLTQANGYSLCPVHAWSHNVSDVVMAAKLLEATGKFEIVTPTALLRAVAQNVVPQ